jgi:hypothetical protein
VRLGFESMDQIACPLEGHLEVVYAEEQKQPVAGRCPLAHQGRMLVRAPLVEAEQDGSICIEDLTEVVMTRRRLALAEKRLVPFQAARYVAYADDRPRAFHILFVVGLTPSGFNER